ncbi:MAG: hypothetical protein H0T78_12595 [Longispora sp.]|nr:hypothetical protein [Longispora sp. (in: high G+C Gram-positive bacteria)]
MCGTCAQSVPAGVGSLTKADGRWVTYHGHCVPVPRAPEAGDHDGWHRRPLAAFDVESTGVRHSIDRVVSASVRDTAGNNMDFLIDPGVDIPVEATATHGITTEHARDNGRAPVEVLDAIAGTLAGYVRSGVPIVIYNAVYDLTLLSCELLRHGLAPLAERVNGHTLMIVDPLVLDRQVDRYRSGGRTLEAVCSFYGVTHPGPHRADADTQACLDLAIAIAARHRDVAAMPSVELHACQIDWYAERVNYMAARNPDRVFDPSWPIARVTVEPWPQTQP